MSYKLETVSGGTPNLGDRAKIYLMPLNQPNLLSLNRANLQARKMGFSGSAQKITDTLYQWQKNKPLPTFLKMDIINYNFTIRKNWQEDQSLLEEKALPIREQAIMEAKNFLQASGLLTDDLENGKAKVSYLRFTPPKLTPVLSPSEADFVRVYLFRDNLDNLPLLPPNPDKALVSVLISGSRNKEKRILEVEYTHFPIAKEIFATYPLKTSAQAWEELKSGKGFIANFKEGKTQITIRKIYLAYFENTIPQNYLQPIYVFEGNDDFVAYVPAIKSEWTK